MHIQSGNHLLIADSSATDGYSIVFTLLDFQLCQEVVERDAGLEVRRYIEQFLKSSQPKVSSMT